MISHIKRTSASKSPADFVFQQPLKAIQELEAQQHQNPAI